MTDTTPKNTGPARPAILFDDGKGTLAPLTDLRPAFHVRTGALTNAERMTRALHLEVVAVAVPGPMIELASDQHGVPVNQPPKETPARPILLLNGRLALPIPEIEALTPGQVLAEEESGDMVAALLTPNDCNQFLTGGNPPMEHAMLDRRVLMHRPWSWRDTRDACLDLDLRLLSGTPKTNNIPEGVTVIGKHAVHIHPTAHLAPTVVLDATHGPIHLDENSVVRPLAIIRGPAYIGPGSTVLDHALIKEHTAIGPVCKVAGEVGGTIFQGYSNKAHAGHLGDSWVGEWVNLGADTTNSNLLNTYSHVLLRPSHDAKHEDTGHQFLGATIGDHTKTAIGTRIGTGTIFGTGTMYAASAMTGGTSGVTHPFAWITDAGIKAYRIGKFVEVALEAMTRRSVHQSQAYARRLTVLHETATGEAAFDWPGKDKSHLQSS
ncbi:MAG: UDP-N-acetylglucosamine diphosphorylase/glucosamine-1-phosphate N-acetyltransferase [Phycisphaerales bacterium]|jgi:UDP-N-acetylglucosamine diphosphorylase/glucosamine-1-phosphate N-acetyltransferase